MEESYFSRAGIPSSASSRPTGRAPWLSFTDAHPLPVGVGPSAPAIPSDEREPEPDTIGPEDAGDALPAESATLATTARPVRSAAGPESARTGAAPAARASEPLRPARREPEEDTSAPVISAVARDPGVEAWRGEASPGVSAVVAPRTVAAGPPGSPAGTAPRGVPAMGVPAMTDVAIRDRLESGPSRTVAADPSSPIVPAGRPGSASASAPTDAPTAVRREPAFGRAEAEPADREPAPAPLIGAVLPEPAPDHGVSSVVRMRELGGVVARPVPPPLATELEVPRRAAPALGPMGEPVPGREVKGGPATPPAAAPAPVTAERPGGRRVHIGTVHVTVKSSPAPAARVAPQAGNAPEPRAPAPHRNPWDAAFVSFH